VSNKNAFGFCDRTGFRYKLDDLVEQWENQKPTGLLVGKDMVDIDQEQLRIGEVDANDPQSLENPRPDQSEAQSRVIRWSLMPVGANMPNLSAAVGKVTVSTS
jgi:hypothetical protein